MDEDEIEDGAEAPAATCAPAGAGSCVEVPAPAGPGAGPAGAVAVADELATGLSSGVDGASWSAACGAAVPTSGAATSPIPPSATVPEVVVAVVAGPVLAAECGTTAASAAIARMSDELSVVAVRSWRAESPGAATGPSGSPERRSACGSPEEVASSLLVEDAGGPRADHASGSELELADELCGT
jgi:hypothetical protein